MSKENGNKCHFLKFFPYRRTIFLGKIVCFRKIKKTYIPCHWYSISKIESQESERKSANSKGELHISKSKRVRKSAVAATVRLWSLSSWSRWDISFTRIICFYITQLKIRCKKRFGPLNDFSERRSSYHLKA